MIEIVNIWTQILHLQVLSQSLLTRPVNIWLITVGNPVSALCSEACKYLISDPWENFKVYYLYRTEPLDLEKIFICNYLIEGQILSLNTTKSKPMKEVFHQLVNWF